MNRSAVRYVFFPCGSFQLPLPPEKPIFFSNLKRFFGRDILYDASTFSRYDDTRDHNVDIDVDE
jgi:hypothetical protein